MDFDLLIFGAAKFPLAAAGGLPKAGLSPGRQVPKGSAAMWDSSPMQNRLSQHLQPCSDKTDEFSALACSSWTLSLVGAHLQQMNQSTKNTPFAPASPPWIVPSGCLAAFRRLGWVGSGWVSPSKHPTLQSRRTRASGGPEGSGSCHHPNGKTSCREAGTTRTQEV